MINFRFFMMNMVDSSPTGWQFLHFPQGTPDMWKTGFVWERVNNINVDKRLLKTLWYQTFLTFFKNAFFPYKKDNLIFLATLFWPKGYNLSSLARDLLDKAKYKIW